ncbi:RING finger protein 44 [Amborella trichopoda]|uniref:RING finger protein 44 n=1 Tax=Amborella trichopoda TaxID=13333 RepID=UPI0005D30F50|nr:RING finger protein 44 [Amborella trichopoda]|eukprot:XP_011622162.1 RING finger protein 44 [Amborella trichopoda]
MGIRAMEKVPYRSAVGSLMYIMTGTRPDLSFVVSLVHLQVHQLLVTMDSFRGYRFLSGFCTVELESSRVRLRSPIVDPQAPIQGNIIIQIDLSEHVSFTSLLAPPQHKKRITIITFTQSRGHGTPRSTLVKLSMEIVREVDDAVKVEASALVEDFVSRTAAGHAVESLERVDMKEDEEIICTICMYEMDFGTVDVRVMPCSHRYHGECIATWLANRSSCPVCRYQLPTAN